MVKLTIVERISDGMPLAQGLRYIGDNNGSLSHYMRQSEFILKEIARGSFAPSPKFIVRLDHQQSFNCLIANGVCFITLCDSWYPRALSFDYLEELRLELEKLEQSDQFIKNVKTPYMLGVKFDSAITNVKKKYLDTRTQANLKKIYANRGRELEIMTEEMSTIIENRIQEDYRERAKMAPQVVSPIWSSRRLEVFAMKWMPIGITISVVITILLWASLVMSDYVVISS
ncbi:25.3 kDa vesicle transport protein SEC22-1 [Silene latifolia]|uniref:25.3 kDa vesicle transport protein SEC22-1 n=1 Tax=Silene latifolia TaxID=37657 RepID=UPI003D76ECEB